MGTARVSPWIAEDRRTGTGTQTSTSTPMSMTVTEGGADEAEEARMGRATVVRIKRRM